MQAEGRLSAPPPAPRPEQIWLARGYEIADTWATIIRILDRTKKSEQQASQLGLTMMRVPWEIASA
jgi:hypothetical protein